MSKNDALFEGDCFGVLFTRQDSICVNRCAEARKCEALCNKRMHGKRFPCWKSKRVAIEAKSVFNFCEGTLKDFVEFCENNFIKFCACHGKTPYVSVYLSERKIMELRNNKWYVVFPNRMRVVADEVESFKSWVYYAKSKIQECKAEDDSNFHRSRK